MLALLCSFDGEPEWARLLIIESPVATLAIGERRQQALRELARALERETLGRTVVSGEFTPSPRLTSELLVGGVLSALQAHRHR